MKRTRSFRNQETFILDKEAPPYLHAFAREVEQAFGRKQDATNFGPFTYKSDIIKRMTDDQVDTFETLLLQTTARMRLTWESILAVYHLDPFFPEFYGMFVDVFGMAEADRILAVSARA